MKTKYFEVDAEFIKGTAVILKSEQAIKDLIPVFIKHMEDFDKKENLKQYSLDEWHYLMFVFIMGVAVGVENKEAIKLAEVMSTPLQKGQAVN